jgi:hypothetical protein
MIEPVTDISKFLSEMNEKFSSMEQAISDQGADISLFIVLSIRKDKEIHVLKKRLSKYEEPDKDSHNSGITPSKESLSAKVFRRTQSCARSQTVRTVVN